MRLRHIELFQAILQTGSLTAAAELLHISQPAASKILKHAEQQLGFALFDRVRGKLQPTAEARVLQQQTERLAIDLQNLRRLADSLGRGEECALRLICTPALAQALLPQALRVWRERFPRTVCQLATQHTTEIVEALLLREADLGLTSQAVEHPGLTSQLLAEGRMRVIAPPGWWQPDELHSPLRLQALAGKALIGIDARDALGSLLRGHIEELDPPPHVVTWVQTYQLARQLVSSGQGVALVDPFTALAANGGEVQTRLLEPAISVPVYALSRVHEQPLPAQAMLLEQLGTQAERLLQDGHN
ncbi:MULTISPECIES: LysR family transcriptional regulator [Stutzerimonas stutzeri subgroup]|jgi:DNA-binding transcriptional LysR family regulator|uniref:LysR family transcriptional regulator n=1 Tax=Stutzerimonas stutzeri NF13 TaxID=1212548 RepID=M2VKE9_STUST|nr:MULTISPECIES: LysR substrate-binding domain-containing protein [Stutzerimonas stutzeri subgroup]EME00448.1 LysR family transcriptional regulator [Stutzerimonas stutzeri NF13]MBK3882841.1 LysR family transcriptional regulator [Stutzerimonas stutzeri]MCQ4290317.1 LysR substrate-binding domain-containing protein [Stutzerimonas stutzeri]WOF79153.1 LysR substrate-binding domain-containing protein [Pseudomonas sp. FeN3W]